MEQQQSQPAPSIPVLCDGELVFRVRRNDGTETDHRLDLLCLKLTCESVESIHRLQVADGRLVPTPEFLLELASRFRDLGLERCTPTTAWQVWIAASEEMGRLKKTPNETPS